LKVINKTNFGSINYIPDVNDLNNYDCLTAQVNGASNELNVMATNCFEKQYIFCRKVLFVKPNCTDVIGFTKKLPFSLMLNPDEKLKYHLSIAYQKAEIMDMIKRTNMAQAYSSFFRSLWYSFTPCFDVRNITAWMKYTSFLKLCEWKGIPMSCSAIFSSFPTDQGVCCSFNMKAAEDIYKKSPYQENLQAMQAADKDKSYFSSIPQKEFTQRLEPQAGVNKGLMVILDAHSEWLVSGSFDEDFHSFPTIIHPSGNFPLMSHGGLFIKPGFKNIITLTSSKLKANDNLRSINKDERRCRFPEESLDLSLHKQYSFFNCKFECTLNYTKKEIYSKYGKKCQPWFFPLDNDSTTICDPWTSRSFFKIMSKDIPDSLCSQCLPDCDSTFYESTIISKPFEKCGATHLGVNFINVFSTPFPYKSAFVLSPKPKHNKRKAAKKTFVQKGARKILMKLTIGVSQFCQFNINIQSPFTEYISNQFVEEITNNYADDYWNKLPRFMKPTDSIREYGYNIFNTTSTIYDAFDRDIAMVEIIYQKPILVQFQSQVYMTWIDYFSAVGGLLGLVLGMGLFSLF